MKYLLVIGTLMLLLGGCAKAKEDLVEKAALNMLDGTEWKIISFTHGGADRSRDFDPYLFRFNKNETVNALRDRATEATGNWKGNIENKTIYAYFPSAAAPLLLLNATWTITQSTSSSLTANTGSGAELRQLKMEKQ